MVNGRINNHNGEMQQESVVQRTKKSQNTEDKDKKEGKKEGFIWP